MYVHTNRKEKQELNNQKTWNTPLFVEAFAIGNKHKKKHGSSTNRLALIPPGPCPKCKDYRYWHYEKDCRAF